jgi:hypothetical protein
MTYSINLDSTNFETFDMLYKLDKKNINSNKYLGLAYFWDCDIKHEMRCINSPHLMKSLHNQFIKQGVKFDSENQCFITDSIALNIINNSKLLQKRIRKCFGAS